MANAKRAIACDCKRRFATAEALAQHRNDSPRHQDNQAQASASGVIPAPIAEGLRTHRPANSVPVVQSTPSANANVTATPSKQQSTGQQKKKKKGQKGGKITSTRSHAYYNPPGHYYYPSWEFEYEMGGPGHTQCSRDCDWCGMCVYREPW